MKEKKIHEVITKESKMAQVDPKMCSMDMRSLSLSSKSPRRRKCGGSLGGSLCGSLGGSTGGGPAGLTGHHSGSVPRLSRAATGDSREIEGLRSALYDRETVIQSLRAELGLSSSSGRIQRISSCGTSSSGILGDPKASPISECDRPLAEQRLARVKKDADSKRVAIKDLKGALNQLDITDNIDVRIRQAELEYALGREELDLLSITEELRTLQDRLEQTQQGLLEQRQTIYSWLRSGAHLTLSATQVSCDPGRPRWGACPGPPGCSGLYVDWAAEGEPLHRGDRLLEVNGKLLTSRSREELSHLLAVSYEPAEIVILRHRSGCSGLQDFGHQSRYHRGATNGSNALRADNLRLTHRISYLEEQVRELQAREQQHVTSISISSPPASPPRSTACDGGISSSDRFETPHASLLSTALSTGAVEVFRRGSQVTTLLHGKVIKPHLQHRGDFNGLVSSGQKQHVTTTVITKQENFRNDSNNHKSHENDQFKQPFKQDNNQCVQSNHPYFQTRLMNGYHHQNHIQMQMKEEKWRNSLDRFVNGDTLRERRTSVQLNNIRNRPFANKGLQTSLKTSIENGHRKESDCIDDSQRSDRIELTDTESIQRAPEHDTNHVLNVQDERNVYNESNTHKVLGKELINCATDDYRMTNSIQPKPEKIATNDTDLMQTNLRTINESRTNIICNLGADMQYDGSRPPMQRIPPERPERPEARRKSQNKLHLSIENSNEAMLLRNRERCYHHTNVSNSRRQRTNSSDGGGRQWDEQSSKSLEFERCSGSGLRPTPPKKPLRLSLHRARSLQTVTSGADLIHQNGAELYSKVDSKRPSKRTHTHAHPTARRLQQQV